MRRICSRLSRKRSRLRWRAGPALFTSHCRWTCSAPRGSRRRSAPGSRRKRLAERLSQGTGPRKLFVPLKGISMIAKQGQVFHDPEADAALIEAIKAHLSDEVELLEYDTDINDPVFAEALVNGLLEAIAEKAITGKAITGKEGEKHGR